MAAILLSHDILAVSISVLALCTVVHVIYQLCFSPLRHIPGPWYAAISGAWLTWHVLHNRQSRAVHSLFEIYGPIIRLTPTRVAYMDAASNKRIYSNSKFPKRVFYKGFLANDNDAASVILLLCLDARLTVPFSQYDDA